jgi:hypothetical protein
MKTLFVTENQKNVVRIHQTCHHENKLPFTFKLPLFMNTALYDNTYNPVHVKNNDAYSLQVLDQAILEVNRLLLKEDFYKQIAALPPFAYATVSPPVIAAKMRGAGIVVKVDVYYSICAEKEIDSFDNEQNPEEIFINYWTIDRSVASICNTIVHGCVHAVNAVSGDCYFGHGSVLTDIVPNAAPYAIGALAETIIDGTTAQPYNLHHDPYEARLRTIKHEISTGKRSNRLF